jgi:UDP-2,3-diacylglucosamine hydrolase
MRTSASTLNTDPSFSSAIKCPIQCIGLIAGEGNLPEWVAKNAAQQGIRVIVLSMSKANRARLKTCSHAVYPIVPGLVLKTHAIMQAESITDVVFAGKVNKWTLLRDPRLDSLAWETIQAIRHMNDDNLMLSIIRKMESYGYQIHPQTDYLQNLFLPAGLLSKRAPTEREYADIQYGFAMAKEMGRLDVGQSVVVKDGMMLAVEAIEGTDECLKRAGKLANKKGGVVVKVAKPNQDQRFDVPTVGPRTLQTMRKVGLSVLAFEASQTLVLDPEAMIAFADRHGISLVSTLG